mgnify:FL=1
MEKTYNTLVCLAVRNDPYGFVDALIEEAGRAENRRLEPMLREAACVIANLLEKQDGRIEP